MHRLAAMELAGKKVGVMGLGLTGEHVARFLLDRGAQVVVSEAKSESEIAAVAEELRARGAKVEAGGHASAVFQGCELVVVSPGVPPRIGALERARSLGARVISEIELASRFLQGRIAAVTGSNGKSTVTALSAAMLSASGMRARPCGNIGLPLISMLGPARGSLYVKDLGREESMGGDGPDVIYVAEVSSFQLEGVETFEPETAALLNLSPDHQDRYDSPADYFAAKGRIFENQTAQDVAVLNADDPPTWSLAARLRSRVVPFSASGMPGDGVHLRGDTFVQAEGTRETPLLDRDDVPLPGQHNLENVAASAAIALSLGARPEAIRRAVREFGALPHRLRFVRTVRGADVYDDSKATNVGSTIRALESFDAPVILLLGGRDKGGDFISLIPHLRRRARAVVCFGEAGPAIADALKHAVSVVRGGALRDATRIALEGASPGDVILLAPACASFDAYTGYAARGDDFVRIVNEVASGMEKA